MNVLNMLRLTVNNKTHVEGGQTDGYIRPDSDDEESYMPHNRYMPQGVSYAQQVKIEEEASMARPQLSKNIYDDVTTLAGNLAHDNVFGLTANTKIYDKYDFYHKTPDGLTILKHQNEILTVVNGNKIIIITGPTGCGKTTQVPQYILNQAREYDRPCNIVVTQPRRIAAISIAKRVCAERNHWNVGDVCGYQVGLMKKVSPDTRLTYMTVGVLLQKLIAERRLDEYTHIIVDEIHERDQDMDFLLIVIKKLHFLNINVRIILMSATVDVQKFANYFQTGDSMWGAVVRCDAKFNYKIHEHYLEDVLALPKYKNRQKEPDFKMSEPVLYKQLVDVAVDLIKYFDVLERSGNASSNNSVLVFLPGIHEISFMHKCLTKQTPAYKWKILPLHSSITEDEQIQVFRSVEAGYRKIILSTNIAESSITVPDVKYVIDFCLTKQQVHDFQSNFTSLKLAWSSLANCTQRKGRVGRVMDGRVYSMIPSSFKKELPKEVQPEMTRCPLESIILNAKLLQMGHPKEIIGLAMDPPDLSNIENMIIILKELGGLLPTVSDVPCDNDGDISFLGRIMAKLPVDVTITKLIVLGFMFRVLEEAIIIGAALTVKSVFSTPFQEQLQAYNAKLEWTLGTSSDCFALLNVYTVWKQKKDEQYFKRSVEEGELEWCKRHFVQKRVLYEIDDLVRELKGRLSFFGIREYGAGNYTWTQDEKELVLNFVIAGAFYPNYFGNKGVEIDFPAAIRELGGKNPFNSVYLKNWPKNQPGTLYAKSICNALSECKMNMKVSFSNSEKAYIEFIDRDLEEGTKTDENKNAHLEHRNIAKGVYRALKIGQIRRNIKIYVLPPAKAEERARTLGINPQFYHLRLKENEEGTRVERLPKIESVLPSINTKTLELRMTYVMNPSNFWVNNIQDKMYLDLVDELLSNPKIQSDITETPKVGDIVGAFDRNDGPSPLLVRARVEGSYRNKSTTYVQVHCLDWGNSLTVRLGELRLLDEETLSKLSRIPPLAFQCKLSEVKPSTRLNSHGAWTREANNYFKQMVLNRNFYGKVYSVVNGVVHLAIEVIHNNEYICINEELINQGYAEICEENYLSKQNHERRQEERFNAEEVNAMNRDQEGANWKDFIYPDPPEPSECRQQILLQGPLSPLVMKVYGYTREAASKSANIAQESINSILLDTEPDDRHERMLVAAHVSQSGENQLTLRHTTLMPNVHGLPSLIMLLFSPRVKLRPNQDLKHYTGALCGLGHTNGRPLFPEHDTEYTFDTVIDNVDVHIINSLRMLMSYSCYTTDNQDQPDFSEAVINQNRIQEYFLRLIERRRQDQQLELPRRKYCWNLSFPVTELMVEDINSKTNRYLYPPFEFFQLQEQ